MNLVLPPGADPGALTRLTEASLGVSARVLPRAQALERDAVTTATLLLQIPTALLATWDLADRMGLLTRVRTWLTQVRAEPATAGLVLELPGRPPRPLSTIRAGEILDAAQRAVGPETPDTCDWDAFLIHAGADRGPARDAWEALVRAGVRAYLDRASLRPGDDWARRLAEAMRRSRVFVVLVSDHWDQGWYNADEVARAVSLCRALPNRALVPVVLGDRPLPAHELPYGLAHVQPVHAGALPPGQLGAAVLDAVQAALGGRERGP